MSLLNPFEFVGFVIEFWYPESNHRGVKRRMRKRRMLVKAIIDMKARRERRPPKEGEEDDPLLNRSQYLFFGIDLAAGGFRQFYDGSMEDIEIISVEPSTIVMEQGFQTGFSVGVIDCELDVPPSLGELPGSVTVTDVLAIGVAQKFASMIAEAANRDAMAAGCKNRWAVVFPPGHVYPNSAMARAAFSRSASA